jgi:phenylalanyl-tRNA synthetase beta subunit
MQFRALCHERNLTTSELARIAILDYLERAKCPHADALANDVLAEMRTIGHRMIAFSSKIAIDVRALYRFFGDTDEETVEQMTMYRTKAIAQISKVLHPREIQMSEQMSRLARRRTATEELQAADDQGATNYGTEPPSVRAIYKRPDDTEGSS